MTRRYGFEWLRRWHQAALVVALRPKTGSTERAAVQLRRLCKMLTKKNFADKQRRVLQS